MRWQRIRASALSCVVFALAWSPAAATAQALDRIRASGTITLGYREASIPFAYLGPGQRPIGFSMDLCAAIVDEIRTRLALPNLTVSTVAVNASNRIPLLQSGRIDIECGSTTNTVDRQRQVAFSVATGVSQAMWLTTAASGIIDANQLRRRTIVVTQGSLNVALIQRINTQEQLNLTILQARDHAESMLMLSTGRAVAFFEDNVLLAGLRINAPNPEALRLLPDVVGPVTYYGLMLPRDDTQLKALVDGVLRRMMASGQFAELYARWFTTAIPPNGRSLDLPVSEALRARVAAPSDSAD